MKTGGLSLDQAPPEDIPARFFLSAPLFGILGAALVAWKGRVLFLSSWMPETIALTHLVTLGWMTMVMLGAFYQMTPVLVGGRVPLIRFARVTHAMLVPGVLAMSSGLIWTEPWLMRTAIVLLFCALALFLLQLTGPLLKADGKRPVVLAMRISLFSLVVVLILGVYALGQVSGWWEGVLERTWLKSTHVTFGFFGWIAGLVLGVGFHVIPMFYLSAPFPETRARQVLVSGLFSLIMVPLSRWFDQGPLFSVLAALPGFAAVLVYTGTVLDRLMRRKRRVKDPTLRFWQFGLVSLCISMPLVISQLLLPAQTLPILFGVFFLGGFALSVTNGMLYKILPFLVWFHRYSSMVGQTRVPLLKDLLPGAGARRQSELHAVSIVLLLAGIAFEQDLLVRIGGAVWGLSAAWLFSNLLYAVSRKPVTVQAAS